jgi:anti-sigma factor ChrR (cupin superfamily)
VTGVTECTKFRVELAVYVVGAIEPAERVVVSWHLSGCQDCRRELADLTALVALLSRVSADDASRVLDPWWQAPGDVS